MPPWPPASPRSSWCRRPPNDLHWLVRRTVRARPGLVPRQSDADPRHCLSGDGGRGVGGLCRSQDLGSDADAAWPQRRRPVRPAADLCRRRQIVPEGNHHPHRRIDRRVPARPDDQLHAGAGGVGGDAVRCRPGAGRSQRRPAVCLRRLLDGRLRHHHVGLGLQLQICLLGWPALCGADGFLRSLDGLHPRFGDDVRAESQPVGHRDEPEGQCAGHIERQHLQSAAVPDGHHVLYHRAGRNQPPSVRSARSRSRARCRLSGGIFVDELRALLPRRICQHPLHVRADPHPVPRWLAAAARLGAALPDPRLRVVPGEDGLHVLRLRLGEGHCAALPL